VIEGHDIDLQAHAGDFLGFDRSNLANAVCGIDHRIANLEFQTRLARHVIPFPDAGAMTRVTPDKNSFAAAGNSVGRQGMRTSTVEADHRTSGRSRLRGRDSVANAGGTHDLLTARPNVKEHITKGGNFKTSR
jgi:hypothetical protein